MRKVTDVMITILACAVIAPLCHAQEDPDAIVDHIVQKLIRSEKKMKIPTIPGDKNQALIAKELELKRVEYARSIELYAEKIGARKDMEKAQIDYEKSLIGFGSQNVNFKNILAGIKQQRAELSSIVESKGLASIRIQLPL